MLGPKEVHVLAIQQLLGLPAHPLLVHAAVVILPVGAAGAVVCAVAPRWRDRAGWVVVGVTALGAVLAQLAVASGESLEAVVRESPLVEDHAGVGDTVVLLAVALFVTSLAMVGLRRRWTSGRGGRVALSILAVAVVLSASATAIWTVRAGHSGAKAVWDDPERPLVDDR